MYINKDTIVAKIENVKNSLSSYMRKYYYASNFKEWESQYELCNVILSFLNSIKTKTVDLEKELIKWHKQYYKKDDTFEKYSGFYFTNHTQLELVKHFYDLGAKTQNNVWHSYKEKIDENKTILIVSSNGTSSLALWDGKSIKTTSLDRGHNVLCKGDKWAYVEQLML